MRLLGFVLIVILAVPVFAQEKSETRELVGHLGSRSALLILHSAQRAEGGWRVAGEYVMLPTLVRRYLEGERSPELGVTTLKEGTSAILFGRPATGELRGTHRGGIFRGTRYGPGGQEREQFEFSEEFPPMEGYSASVRCDAGDARYASTLAYAVEAGKMKSMEWQSQVAPNGHRCKFAAAEQHSPAAGMRGALRFVSGKCAVTLRDLGEYVKVDAENCASACGSEAYLEPMLVDRRGNCRLLRPEAK
jgi:hypothetical protein